MTDGLFLQGALRYENYEDFDSEILFQLAGRLELTDTWNARASIGTGFRAPTPGQQGTVNVSTRLPDGIPVATGCSQLAAQSRKHLVPRHSSLSCPTALLSGLLAQSVRWT